MAKFIIYKAISSIEYERIFFCKTANDMWKNILEYHQEKCQVKDDHAHKHSIVDKYLVDVSTSTTSSNVLCVGNDVEDNESHDESKHDVAMITKVESSDDDASSSDSDEEYAKAVKEFKRLAKRRKFVQVKRRMTRRKGLGDKESFVAQASNEVCLGVNLEHDEWVKDSGCSKHMTGNRNLFSTYKAYNGGNVIFGSDRRGKIIGKGTISQDSLTIDNVEHVDNLTYNLLSVGQICDNKCSVTFTEKVA